jgi:DNA-directed RNA polymerase specialized sigma24 family protein
LDSLQPHPLASEPSPLDVIVLPDEVEQLMRQRMPLERRIIELRLQGYTLDEIAADTSFCQRTVRRVLERVKQHLEQGRALNPRT